MKRPPVTQERIDAVKTLVVEKIPDYKITDIMKIGTQTLQLIRASGYDLDSYKELYREKRSSAKPEPSIQVDALTGMILHIEEMVEKLMEQLVKKDDTPTPVTFFKHDAANQQGS